MKYLYIIIGTVCMAWRSLVSAQIPEDRFFYGDEFSNEPTTSFGNLIKEDVVNPSDGVLKRILVVFNLEQFIISSDASALEFIKYIINIALGLISFIALIIIIYGFVQVFFAKDDEGITTARKTIQGAAIAIAIIAVSWMIVTFLFALYEMFTQ